MPSPKLTNDTTFANEEAMSDEARVIYDFGAARVVSLPGESLDIFVQKRDGVGGWDTVGSYNRMSDDYAFTNARDAAEKLARRIEGR